MAKCVEDRYEDWLWHFLSRQLWDLWCRISFIPPSTCQDQASDIQGRTVFDMSIEFHEESRGVLRGTFYRVGKIMLTRFCYFDVLIPTPLGKVNDQAYSYKIYKQVHTMWNMVNVKQGKQGISFWSEWDNVMLSSSFPSRRETEINELGPTDCGEWFITNLITFLLKTHLTARIWPCPAVLTVLISHPVECPQWFRYTGEWVVHRWVVRTCRQLWFPQKIVNAN